MQLYLFNKSLSLFFIAYFFLSSFSFSIKLTMNGFPLLLVSYIAVVSASCPDGWWKAGEFCYVVSQSVMNWSSPQEEGSRLKILLFTYSVFAVLLGKGGIPCRYKESRTRRSFG